MTIEFLGESIAHISPFSDLNESCVAQGQVSWAFCPPGLRPILAASLATRHPERLFVYLTSSSRTAEETALQLQALVGENIQVALFPSWETLPHERLSPQIETMAARIAVLRRLAKPEPAAGPAAGPINILVVPLRAALQPIISGLGELEPLRLRVGQNYGPEQVVARLMELGYERTDMVCGRGQVVGRGGIVDVFVPGDSHPQRIEYFGDTVEEIRYFSIANQRTVARSEQGVWAPACRELLLTEEVRQRAGEISGKYPGLAEQLELIGAGLSVAGMETLAPLLGIPMVSLFSLLPAQSSVIALDPEKLSRQALDLIATSTEFEQAAWHAASVGGRVPVQMGRGFQTLAEIYEQAAARKFTWSEWSSLRRDAELSEHLPKSDDELRGDTKTVQPSQNNLSEIIVYHREYQLPVENSLSYRGDIKFLLKDLQKYQQQQWQVVIAVKSSGYAQRYAQSLREAGLESVRLDLENSQNQPNNLQTAAPSPLAGEILVTVAPLPEGFLLPEAKIAVITEKEITGRGQNLKRVAQKLPARQRSTVVDPLSLKPGDYVVHDYHGVAKFVELTKRSIGLGKTSANREYLVLEYAPTHRGQPGDRLYVPTDSLDQISRYTGSDTPSVNKMGGSDWAKTKAKARKATREIAAELVRLYAARRASEGYAFSPDTPWQRELEDAFIYAETPDQLLTIDEVKADMEKPIPMDRLLCGDVGYGKTEVAVRAAFKAIQDGKQVAVLCPTTLLVSQHFETFAERYAPFPVKIAQLSRFSTPAQAKRVKEGLSKGEIDLVIGTHTLLTGSVYFKDLGLVIIDEEQRFGVEHKEALKALRTNVDVLAMSATPIPRTLEMAVTGIRELSTLATPPEDRHPVLTFVGPLQNQQVKAAIKRELMREGQVFYVHNRVQSIYRRAQELAELIPEARICVAHGQMGEKQLEKVMVDFWNREYDVLVCTTIVETGLDIANANTLIVENAQKMGLSQLHQLRGRVGRARERAYAYFLYPPEQPLTELAHERLATIAANTDLGSGAAVAQKDLEIRGAGNLLGGEQSGHIAGVGFDLYIRMVSEAVTNFRQGIDGTKNDSEDAGEMRVELHLDAHIPIDYIESERLRLEIYQKISFARTEEELTEIAAELRDRYGDFGQSVQQLFTMAQLRQLLREKRITEVVLQGKYLRIGPVELTESQTLRLKRLYPGTVIKLAVRQVLVPIPQGKKLGEGRISGDELVCWAVHLIEKILTAPVGAV